MQAAAYVGRVGGLAIALGVGMAVATGSGVASADSTGTDPERTTSVSDGQQGATTTNDTGAPTDDVTKPAPPESKLKGKRKTFDEIGRAMRDFVDRGVAVGTGGSLSSARQEEKAERKTQDREGKTADDDAKKAAEDDAKPRTIRADTESAKQSWRLKVAAAKPDTEVNPPRVRVAEKVVDKVVQKVAEAKKSADAAVDKVVQVVAESTEADTVTATDRVTPARLMTMRFDRSVEQAAVFDVAPVAVATVPRLVTGLLSGFGLDSLSSNPFGPTQSPVVLSLMALASRREAEENLASSAGTTIAAEARTAQPLAAAAVTAPVTTRIGWMTGANSINDTVNRFGIYGTDIGVMWDNGVTGDNPNTQIVEQREVLIAFGDTFSGPNNAGWRMNTLFRSPDRVLADGLYVPDGIIHDPGAYSGSPMTYQNYAREIIGNYHYGIGSEVTMIPTAAVSVPGAGANGATRQYVQFMAVRSWDSPGRWTTNYSAIAYSDDNGQNWTVVPRSSVRTAAQGRATVPYVAGNENFQMGAFVKPPAGSPEAAAGWVYSYGTPAGRGGTVYLSRVNQKDILDVTKYEYWNGTSWVKNKPSAAKPVLPGTTTSSFFGLIKTTTYPSAGEMSVQYNQYLKKYVMLYTDQNNNVVMRTADKPQGTWSTPKTLVTSQQYPGLYAPMIHPWSGTSQLLKADGTPEDPKYLYWGLSQWNEYNIALMSTDLSRV